MSVAIVLFVAQLLPTTGWEHRSIVGVQVAFFACCDGLVDT